MDFLWYLLGIGAIVVGLGISIAIHELGHLIPAKLFKVKVTQYMIGFGPTLWSKTKGETEYGVKAIPLGGFISMVGMYPPEKVGAKTKTGFFGKIIAEAREASAESIEPGDEERAFYKLKVWQKLIVMFGGPFTNLVLGIALISWLLIGFGLPAQSTTVEAVNECVLPQSSNRDYCLSTDPKTPAAVADLRSDDVITHYNGVAVNTWLELTTVIRETTEPTTIQILRDGQPLTIDVSPITSQRQQINEKGELIVDSAGNPVLVEVGFLGVVSKQIRVPQGAETVVPFVTDNMIRIGQVIISLPMRLYDASMAAFGPEERDPNGPLSLVGVGRIAGEIASNQSLEFSDRAAGIIGVLASLNLGLFAFNMIPLPPLDGGHIFGALWEGTRKLFARLTGRPDPGAVDMAKAVPVTLAVLAFFVLTTVILIYADLVKPIQLF